MQSSGYSRKESTRRTESWRHASSLQYGFATPSARSVNDGVDLNILLVQITCTSAFPLTLVEDLSSVDAPCLRTYAAEVCSRRRESRSVTALEVT